MGGALRDLLLGLEARDVDLAFEGDAEETARFAAALAATRGWTLSARHERFGTATLVAPSGRRVDVAAARRETYPVPGALPVVTGKASIREDLARRDFTVHAMSRRVGADGTLGALLDPHGGRDDLACRTLRLLHDHSLADDPTRAMRAAKYATRLGFRLERAFDRRLAASRAACSWGRISGDRLRRGLEEILGEPGAALAVELLRAHGVLDDIVPGWGQAPPDAAILTAARTAGERWAALLAPVPTEVRRRVAERLAFSKTRRREVGVAA